jgi:hypothetical protein
VTEPQQLPKGNRLGRLGCGFAIAWPLALLFALPCGYLPNDGVGLLAKYLIQYIFLVSPILAVSIGRAGLWRPHRVLSVVTIVLGMLELAFLVVSIRGNIGGS